MSRVMTEIWNWLSHIENAAGSDVSTTSNLCETYSNVLAYSWQYSYWSCVAIMMVQLPG